MSGVGELKHGRTALTRQARDAQSKGRLHDFQRLMSLKRFRDVAHDLGWADQHGHIRK